MALAHPPSEKTDRSVVGRSARVVAGGVVWLAVLAGCRSASQTDLVEREMREQEDQIYALQDYLADYQQLLCEYRRENESLKRQMVTDQFREGLPAPRRGEAAPRRRETVPPLQTTPIPPGEPTIPDENTSPNGVPPLEFDDADVPPIDTTSADDPDTVSLASVDGDDQFDAALEAEVRGVTPAGFDEPLPVAETDSTVQQVYVHGEVWPGDATTGPRVMASVAPLTASGRPAEFQGDLSLMILDASAEGDPVSLARWDFTPDDWQPLVVAGADGTVLELPLQLPAHVPTDRLVELWVRLVPDDGGKVLTHTPIDLDQPGQFATVVSTQPDFMDAADGDVDERPVIAADRAVHTAANDSYDAVPAAAPVRQSDWQTARPGQVPSFAASNSITVSDWRTATQPIPAVPEPPIYPTPPPRDTVVRRDSTDVVRRDSTDVVRRDSTDVVRGDSTDVVRGSPDPARYASRAKKSRYDETPPAAPRAPQWSPDRPGDADAKPSAAASGSAPLRPTWSPER